MNRVKNITPQFRYDEKEPFEQWQTRSREKLIELFLQMAISRNTQLIFTTHESRLLAEDMLRNDEICFTMKNNEGASIINPLERYQLRADKRIYAALFDGTIEEVPNINTNKLNEVFVSEF